MFGILGLGFVLGMQHAFEADHLAAVWSIAASRTNIADIVKHGLTWGLGHTVTLFLFAGAALLIGHAIPDYLSRPLEGAVGVMLVCLGADLLWRLRRTGVRSNGRMTDLHGHGSAHGLAHADGRAVGFRWRTLMVGLMHGMAGSAALLVLVVSQAASPAHSLLYVLFFGIGSMIGMAAISSAIAVPMVISARVLTLVNRLLQLVAAAAAIVIGVMTLWKVLPLVPG